MYFFTSYIIYEILRPRQGERRIVKYYHNKNFKSRSGKPKLSQGFDNASTQANL